jgi:hypothetical protein
MALKYSPRPELTGWGMGMVGLWSGFDSDASVPMWIRWTTLLQTTRSVRLAARWTGDLVTRTWVDRAVQEFRVGWARAGRRERDLVACDLWMRVGRAARANVNVSDVVMLAGLAEAIVGARRPWILATLRWAHRSELAPPLAAVVENVRRYTGSQIYKRLRTSLRQTLDAVEARFPVAIREAADPRAKAGWFRVWTVFVQVHPIGPDDVDRIETWHQLVRAPGVALLLEEMLVAAGEVGHKERRTVEMMAERLVGLRVLRTII